MPLTVKSKQGTDLLSIQISKSIRPNLGVSLPQKDVKCHTHSILGLSEVGEVSKLEETKNSELNPTAKELQSKVDAVVPRIRLHSNHIPQSDSSVYPWDESSQAQTCPCKIPENSAIQQLAEVPVQHFLFSNPQYL